jgi:virginiamycin A acetyltransferase
MRWHRALREWFTRLAHRTSPSTFETVWRSQASLQGPGQIEIGPHTYWSPTVRFVTWGTGAEIAVGSYCSIAHGVQILAGADHGVSRLSTYAFGLLDEPAAPDREPLRSERVEIGNDVWIGTSAILVGPLRVGDGAVIGAGAVVVSEVPAYALVGGVPARVIRMRLPSAAVVLLERLRWWDWPVDTVREAEPLLRGADWRGLERFAMQKGLLDSEAGREE